VRRRWRVGCPRSCAGCQHPDRATACIRLLAMARLMAWALGPTSPKIPDIGVLTGEYTISHTRDMTTYFLTTSPAIFVGVLVALRNRRNR